MSAQFVSRSLPLFLSIAECRRLQYEHPHAWPPCEFLSGHSVSGPERCRAAGKANWRARCGVFTNGYKREPLAAYGYRCQQEEGRKERYNRYNERSQSSAVGCVCVRGWGSIIAPLIVFYIKTMNEMMTCNVKVDTCNEVCTRDYY